MPTGDQKLRLGSRASLLALAQSNLIAAELMRLHPDLQIELIPIKTTGDRITDRPLREAGGKGLFTKELEQALLRNEIDFAVHSFKDVPITMPLVDQADLITAAVPQREDPRDVLISLSARSIQALAPGARVGTGSLRRRCQLLRARPDLTIEPIRGNIDTRLQKLRRGEFDAIVLALAGLRRSGLFDPSTMFPIDPDDLLPAPGQGALSLQCRRNDDQPANCSRRSATRSPPIVSPSSAKSLRFSTAIAILPLPRSPSRPIRALACVWPSASRMGTLQSAGPT
jgi:hydroxymethylbilane synthase